MNRRPLFRSGAPAALAVLWGCSGATSTGGSGGLSGARAPGSVASNLGGGGSVSAGNATSAVGGAAGAASGGAAGFDSAEPPGGDGTSGNSTGNGESGVAGAAAGTPRGDAGSGGQAGAGLAGNAGVGATGSLTSYPAPSDQHRAIGVHDPSMIQVGATYYLFATGGLLSFRSSTDLSNWPSAGRIFSALPAWITSELGQTITDLWAPDISLQNGMYRVYYAGSVFGSNHSVIGLATNTTLDQKSADYEWVDQGLVIESSPAGSTDDWNAIDPSFVRDESGNSWLVLGSFWSGIKLRKLDSSGKLSSTDTTLYSLANDSGGIEAPSIVFHNGYYYLFVSYDLCCKGVDSTYRTMVGRSSAITGPYTDNTGKAMLQGNALQMLAKDGRYIGPGGGSAFRDGSLYYYAYHYYDGQANGASFLMLRPIAWTVDDWPLFSAPLWQ
jgi:arabinan endo-1,5-alpha-L-arabinosidase